MTEFFNGYCLDAPEYWAESAWTQHIPFAFWLVPALRPRKIVELGTHHGMSYFAFCQAVATAGLDTKCIAVDTWQGDEHAGFYSDDVYGQVEEVNNTKYSRFSTLIRATFDEAVDQIDDHSIDLLHIDGRHRYDDVRHDFETWMPKLSDRAVVLLHDTEVRHKDFGVWKYWKELESEYRTFNFHHGNGLGVLGFGDQTPEALNALFDLSNDAEAADHVRLLFSVCGESLELRRSYDKEHDPLRDMVAGFLAKHCTARESLRVSLATKMKKRIDSLSTQTTVLNGALAYARSHPLRNLYTYSRFRMSRLLSHFSAPLFPKLSERLDDAAKVRDPQRSLTKTQ